MNLNPTLGINFLIAKSRMRWRCNFKGLSQDGGRADISETLCSSLFNDDLSKEPTFSQIHLAGFFPLES
jgi:hypothetical protein